MMSEDTEYPEHSSEGSYEHTLSSPGDLADNTGSGGEPRDEGSDEEPTEVEGGVPEEYATLLGERSLLWYECRDEYEDFENCTFVELRPKGVVECILVRDFVNYEWETRRFRRLMAAATYRELAIVASDTLSKAQGNLLERVHDQQLVVSYVRGSAMGISEAKNSLKERAGARLIRPVDLHCAAHVQALNVIEALCRQLAHAERRRDQVLKQLEDRRMTLATMARSIVLRGQAETIDADVGPA